MTTINTYLTFEGSCEEAFNFYKSVFGGDFSYLARFSEMPPQEGMPPVPAEDQNKIMHVSLPISKETVLMGSDTGGGWGDDYVAGNNFSLSVNPDSTEEADRLFNELAQNGSINMPMSKTFWGSYFGTLTDQFGINWMIDVDMQNK